MEIKSKIWIGPKQDFIIYFWTVKISGKPSISIVQKFPRREDKYLTGKQKSRSDFFHAVTPDPGVLFMSGL